MKYLILFLLVSSPGVSICQSDSLVSELILFEAIDRYYDNLLEADLVEFDLSKKGNWLKYLPSVGIAYTPAGAPRPSVSVSSSVIYQSSQDKKLREQSEKAVKMQNSVERNETKRVVRILVSEYENEEKRFESRREIREIERQLQEITKAKYERLEITPEVYLRARKGYLETLQKYDDFRNEQRVRMKDIYLISKIDL